MIDLHTHSCYSDGTDTPAELLKKAHQISLTGLALTDHDTVEGCIPFQKEALNYPNILAINGCEFTTDYAVNVEIIALNIKNLSPYIERQKILKTYRKEVAIKRIEKLNKLGFKIELKDIIFDEKGKERPLLGKPHIVNYLYNTNQISNKEIGYKQLLNKGCPAYEKQKSPTVAETIDFIRQTGAVSILAHPCLIGLKGQDFLNMLYEFKKLGLQGMEVQHSDMIIEDMAFYTQIADDFNLLKSGGSDYHGENAHYGVHLGVGKGQVQLPHAYLEQILEASNKSC